MKPSKLKTALSLLIAVALLAGMLSGCQPPPENPTSPSNSTSPAEQHTADDYRGVTKPTPPTGYFQALPDDYQQVSSPWAAETISLPDAWNITTGSSTIRVGVID